MSREYYAFPKSGEYHARQNGLTKREYFAACALQGLTASAEDGLAQGYAEFAVKCADALIAELEKPQLEPGEPDRPIDPHYTGGKSL